ncbi:hypothetical protein GC163_22820 [bacterium]|nr:hypothetical protein [bacterium]
MSTSFACRLGLLAFAATTLDAAWSGADLAGGLTNALIRMVLFYGLGLVAGGLASALMEEQSRIDFEQWKASVLAQTDANAANSLS